MKNKILKNVLLHMLICSVILFVVVSYVFTVVDNSSADRLAKNTFLSLEKSVDQSNTEVDNMVKQFGDDNKAKAKALSIILDQKKPEDLTVDSLEEIRVALDADEIIVTDGKGNIVVATTPYMNYNISTREELKKFMSGLTNRTYNDVNNVVENDSVTQYVCTSRYNTDGLVIIKCDTRYVSKSVQYAGASNVVSGQSLVSGGKVAVIDTDKWVYLSNTDQVRIGQGVQINKNKFTVKNDEKIRKFKVTVDGVKSQMYYKNYKDNILTISLPQSKIFVRKNYVCGAVVVSLVILMITVFLAIRNKMIQFEKNLKYLMDNSK